MLNHNQRTVSAVLLAIAVLGTPTGCAMAADDDVRPDPEAIIRGAASPESEDAVVLLVIEGQARCTATLVAPSLLLTARHCVSDTDESLECSASGAPIAGGRVYGDRDPASFVVYTGRTRDRLRARALGARIVRDSATNLCNHDLAFVVLDRPILDIAPMALRLDDSTSAGETVTAVGWGITERTTFPATRRRRLGVRILDVGPSTTAPSRTFVVGESICSGDSGGPALSAAQAVVGVVSAGGNGLVPTGDPSTPCRGPSTRNTYSRVAAYAGLVRRAFAAAHALPRPER